MHIGPITPDRELYAAPSGYVVGLRREIGTGVWLVRVLNFATYRHVCKRFETEAAAREEYAKWCF